MHLSVSPVGQVCVEINNPPIWRTIVPKEVMMKFNIGDKVMLTRTDDVSVMLAIGSVRTLTQAYEVQHGWWALSPPIFNEYGEEAFWCEDGMVLVQRVKRQ